jgi:CheY-like chemotaxis protein
VTSRGLVMVIDEDVETQELLSVYLRKVGYEASVAANGPDALELLRGGPGPAAIVCDAAVPSAGGRSVVEQIRSGSNAAPVLLMTSSRARSGSGADASIGKPFQLVDFGDKLLRMLRQRREAS